MIIELRVKRQGVAWEQVEPVLADIGDSPRRETQRKRANALANALASGSGQEVRWNYQDSQQGHYIGGG